MNHFVADTHALYWYIVDAPQLGKAANQAFIDAEAGGAQIHIPSIVLAELFYMNEKLGRPLDFADTVRELRSATQFVLHDLTPDHVLDFGRDASVPEMHDRIVPGVARRLNAPCLTRDRSIVASGLVPVVW